MEGFKFAEGKETIGQRLYTLSREALEQVLEVLMSS
jgi:hypothetical protein